MIEAVHRLVRPLLLALPAFVLGSLFAGAVVAQPNPTPGPPLPVLERNLDANGWIKVHEQGTAQVTGSVNISNFPGTQNVNVTGGQISAEILPVTIGYSSGDVCATAGAIVNYPLPATINATNLSIVEDDDDEFAIYFKSPIAISGPGAGFPFGPAVFSVQNHDGDNINVHHAFTRPVPIDAILYHCTNESTLCCALVDIVGTPGS